MRGVPRLSPTHVDRARLQSVLAATEHRNLVLVSAAAGTGKTELLAEWARAGAGGRSVGWITFEPGDDRFWVPFTDALWDAGVDVPAAFQHWTGGRPSDRLLALLMDAVRRAPGRVAVVLDNWEPSARQAVAELDVLVRHCAERLLLVVAGRSDPQLPLPRYRLDDTVLEVRLGDLAFSDEEAGALLDRLGVRPLGGRARQVNARVHGWAAGVVFLGRALRDGGDPGDEPVNVLPGATGIDQYVVSEVLDKHSARLRRFLLETSALETLRPDDLEQLLGPTARLDLHDIVHGNAFVEPVPGDPSCFRYQPFFHEVLRAQRADESARLHGVRWEPSEMTGARSRGLSVLPRQRSAAEPTPDLVESLTAREMEVLWHLEELLTTDEMAARMFVSVNTVRSHVRNVLRKLDVDRRNAAVRRGRELGLIPARRS